jgi:hypothetical protein
MCHKWHACRNLAIPALHYIYSINVYTSNIYVRTSIKPNTIMCFSLICYCYFNICNNNLRLYFYKIVRCSKLFQIHLVLHIHWSKNNLLFTYNVHIFIGDWHIYSLFTHQIWQHFKAVHNFQCIFAKTTPRFKDI